MNDFLLILGGVGVMVFLYLVGKVIDALGECWHKWDKWIVWQTEHAYCQGRKCAKCGQQQIMQTRKMNDGHTDC